jgi:hypothetical protein
MWKSLALLFIPLLILSDAIGEPSDRLKTFKEKFPYGLLNNDHGILNVNDLAINACIAIPKPFKISSNYYPYEYWQCFESKSISLSCDSNDTPDEHEGLLGLVVVKASIDKVQHEYIESRLWPRGQCKQFIKDVAAILKGTRYACISGSFNDNSLDGFGNKSFNWLFERIKTKKGCEGRGCEFTKKFKHDICPKL